MATIPSAKDMGVIILDIFKRRNIRAGERLSIQIIETVWFGDNNRADDLQSGLIWLIDNGYLEKKDRSYVLTEKGFDEM